MFKNLCFAIRTLSLLAVIFITTSCGVKGDLIHPSEQNSPATDQNIDDSEEQS
ncbi:lipoprotein [Aliiglaciecola sp. SL4]|uniref:LptM family lipoprotein n=1 Tax=Aliiglaciecola sp. SL4 TaxID=3239806 RepID=UPI00355C0ADF